MVGDCHEIDAGRHGVKVKEVLTPSRKYRPFLCDVVMRIGGWLQKSEFSFDIKHSIVLPKRRVTFLLGLLSLMHMLNMVILLQIVC